MTKQQLTTRKMKVFARLSNGNQAQIELTGNMPAIIKYIENYEGDDLGNDLICEDIVTDFTETGVIIYAENREEAHETVVLSHFSVPSPCGGSNEIEVYTTPILKMSNSCIVFDRSCQLERRYTIGKDAFLNWEQFENGYKPVKSFDDVISAWQNREIHF